MAGAPRVAVKSRAAVRGPLLVNRTALWSRHSEAARERALHWRWRREKLCQSVCQAVERRLRSNRDPDEVSFSRAGEMPDEHSALTQRRRQGLAGVARMACENEVGAGSQNIEAKPDQSRSQARPISDDGRSRLLEIGLVLDGGDCARLGRPPERIGVEAVLDPSSGLRSALGRRARSRREGRRARAISTGSGPPGDWDGRG